jgi:glucose-1-phosphate thymidylyltransferase
MSTKTINTPINNLKIHLNKVVADERGIYCDMAPGGTDNPFFKDGIKHIHGSIAIKKLIPRGGHYHYHLRENFYTLSGTALWYFYDFRKDSPTYQTGYSVVLGFNPTEKEIDVPSYAITQGSMAQIFIPPGVYHIFWPLTDEKVIVAGTGSLDYDSADYARPEIKEVPGAKEVFEKIKKVFEIPSMREKSEREDVYPRLLEGQNFSKEGDIGQCHLQREETGSWRLPKMKAIIAAGRSDNLRPLTHTMNKHLIPLANKPMIFYAIEHLAQTGFKEIGIVVSPEDKELPKVVGDGERWNIKIQYFLQTGGALGLAHAIKVSWDYLCDDPFIFYLGDNIIKENLQELINKFFNEKLNCLLGLAKIKNPQRFGVPIFENGKIIKVEERPMEPKSEFAVTGFYIYDKNVHQIIDNLKPSSRGEFEISDVQSELIGQGFNVGWHKLKSWWKDRGKPEDILEGNSFALEEINSKIEGLIDSSVEIQGKVDIGANSKILGNSVLRGPISIAQGATIRDSYIGPFTSIGNRAEVYNSEIESSLIMDESYISNPSRIVNSLIGRNSSVISSKNKKPSGHKIIVGENSKIEL